MNMRNILAVMLTGSMLPLCAIGTPNFGVQCAGVLHTKHARSRHRSEIQIGAHAYWHYYGHGLLTEFNITQNDPLLGGYYVYHFEGKPTGFSNMIGITTRGVGFGVGYDCGRHFGVQAKFTTSHNTVHLGAKYTFQLTLT